MERFGSIEKIFDFAIAKEMESNLFYLNLSKMAVRPEIKEVFESIASEELIHKKKIEEVAKGKYKFPPIGTIPDMKIADYTVADEPTPSIAYQDALVLAMKKEEASFKLYSDLANISSDAAVKDTFLGLAQEEAKHKLRFEIEYDEHILKEN
jgi:rubrerythrin